jgi:hypothetical protein
MPALTRNLIQNGTVVYSTYDMDMFWYCVKNYIAIPDSR